MSQQLDLLSNWQPQTIKPIKGHLYRGRTLSGTEAEGQFLRESMSGMWMLSDPQTKALIALIDPKTAFYLGELPE